MIVFERPIRFDEVDPAGIVFFARYANFAHEAIENFFEDLEGGYPALIQKRRIGLPIVRYEADFHAPLRFGDDVELDVTVARLGAKSITFRYRVYRVGEPRVLAAEGRVVCAVVDLARFVAVAVPERVTQMLADLVE